MTSKYAEQRLSALWDRIEKLERAVEVAGAFLERADSDPGLLAIYAPLALTTLNTGIQEEFRASLLCERDTTDDMLDHWLGQVDKPEAEAATTNSGVAP